ncbi:sensor domain-containing diguanylate cyclase [Methylotenera versatilis]|uniref:diguanylate cyclase n=1 Tax=Methylotenera versatilis (strain 301) TaxID=666681 RepID=D7DKL7_METV0|nr:diguanylate cyclase [Methylotenera versatilis]ADI30463.1 diguanylate cyclase [Methylotenera versatilis 301]
MKQSIPTPSFYSYLFLPLAYFISVKLCLGLAMTPEGTVIIWLANAFTLTALLYYRGQRYWVFILFAIAAEIAADVPTFPWYEGLMLGVTNTIEVTLAYLIMRKVSMSPSLYKLEDVIKFIVAGPFIASLIGALIGAAIIKFFGVDTGGYLSIVQVWWFGDALGLIIGIPLLLSLLYYKSQPIKPLIRIDLIVAVISTALLLMLTFGENGLFLGVVITPTLLLPSMLYLAARTDLKCTAIAVFIVSFALALVITAGRNPFGNLSISLTILHAQEFIAILSIASMGFATLLSRIRDNERELEDRVSKRTDELQLLNHKLEGLSKTDGLTGIANRRSFDDVLEIEWMRAKRANQPLALAMLDIDWFKRYNDHYGHQAGDECLRRVSNILASNLCRTGDLVARYGGEEFVFIAPAISGDQALEISRKICEALHSLALPHELSTFGYVTVSVGVASITPQGSQKSDVLVKMADDALYQAKEQGRNRALLA